MKFDLDLIYLYSEQARMKLKEIAKALKKSPQRTVYSMQVLEKQEILHHPFTIFDYSYFGMILFKVYFKGAYITEKEKEKLVDYLSKNPYVIAVYELSGEFDLVIEMESPNPSRFNKELKKIATENPKLNNYKVILNLVTHLYPRTYMVKNQIPALISDETIVGGDREIYDYNDSELAIMSKLLEQPQIRLSTLSKKAGLNVRTAKSILNKLQTNRIIKGYKMLIDHNQLGISRVRLLLRLHNIHQEREHELLNYMLKTPEIIHVNKTVGDWDIEIDIESLEKKRIRELILEIREEYTDIIENFNIMDFYHFYWRRYLPTYIFKK